MGLGIVAPSTYQNSIKLDELKLNEGLELGQWQHPTNGLETSWGASTSIDKGLSMLGSASN